MDNISQAIVKWQEILGENKVIIDKDQLIKNSVTTTGVKKHPICRLEPDTSEEVSKILEIANEFHVTVYPYSRGNNHGYNSSCSYSDKSVLINLSDMKRIISYDNYFGYIEIEPGVTFKQLYEYVANHMPDRMISGFGGSMSASIIGNALDRGVGKGVYGNREKSSIITEVITAQGAVLNLKDKLGLDDITGVFSHATVGPSLNELFYQSNYGVVTKMIVYLESIPEYMTVLAFSVPKDDMLPKIVEKLNLLNKLKVIEPVYSLYNDERLAVGSGLGKKSEYIDQGYTTKAAIKDIIDKLSERYKRKLSRWNSSFAIHCSCKEESDLRIAQIQNILGDTIDGFSYSSITKSQAKEIIQNSLSYADSNPPESEFKFLFNLGFTNDYDQQTLYWKSKASMTSESVAVIDGSGLIFFVPKIPFKPENIKESLEIVKTISDKYDYEVPVTYQFKSQYFCYLVLPVLFDKNNQNDVDKAYKYYIELFNSFKDKGYIPYRVPDISMRDMFSKDTNYNDLTHKIKTIFDPNNIIDPIKYMYHK
ncbi:FAD-binding oxidoreductase [bacterium SCSIO 12844]|nr:FAD-binding oxidoreductase [bacterium SCSIO 12844]